LDLPRVLRVRAEVPVLGGGRQEDDLRALRHAHRAAIDRARLIELQVRAAAEVAVDAVAVLHAAGQTALRIVTGLLVLEATLERVVAERAGLEALGHRDDARRAVVGALLVEPEATYTVCRVRQRTRVEVGVGNAITIGV